MKGKLEIPVVTAEDVLRGYMDVTVEARNGNTKTVRVKPMPWRTALFVGQAPSESEAYIRIFSDCLSADQAKDEFLDTITPAWLMWVATVAMQLSQGVVAAKARMATATETAAA